MVGKEQSLRDYVKHLQSKGWNIEEKGPFRIGDKFHYLKREFRLCRDCCDIRCDYKQYESLAEDTNVYSKAYRKTPMDQSFAKQDESPQLEGQDITKFRSVVGRLMYLAGERPEIFVDGNLMESRVRTQKSVALSSGESEFVAVVAGCSDGLLIKHLWMQVTGEGCQMRVRSGSSAAARNWPSASFRRIPLVGPAKGEGQGAHHRSHSNRAKLRRRYSTC